jgi:hypothetical protein
MILTDFCFPHGVLMVLYYALKLSMYEHTLEHYFAIKRCEILIHAAAWMNLENIMLKERSQTQSPHVMYFIYMKYLK